MKTFSTAVFLILTVFGFQNTVNACIAPGIKWNTDIEYWVQNYGTCTEINGSVELTGDLTNVDFLKNITYISGTLSIKNLDSIDLKGLDQLDSIGNFLYINTVNAANLEITLPNLIKCRGINIYDSNIGGDISFPKLKEMEDISICRSSFQNVRLDGLEIVEEILIEDLTADTLIFQALKSITRKIPDIEFGLLGGDWASFEIKNSTFKSIELPTLQQVEHILISTLYGINELNFPQLQKLASLSLNYGDYSKINIPKLDTVYRFLSLFDTKIKQVSSENLRHIGGYILISNNDSLQFVSFPMLQDLDPIGFYEGANYQLEAIHRTSWIYENQVLTSVDFGHVDSIFQSLKIEDNPLFNDLKLDYLKYAKRMYVYDFKDVLDIPNIEFIGDLEIHTTNMVSVSMNNLQTIKNFRLFARSSCQLSMPALDSIYGSCDFYFKDYDFEVQFPKLSHANGLSVWNLKGKNKLEIPKLLTVNQLYVRGMLHEYSLEIFSNIKVSGSLYLIDNKQLNDISILEQYEKYENLKYLKITDNPNLNLCDYQIICEFMNDTARTLILADNGEDCNTMGDIDCRLFGLGGTCFIDLNKNGQRETVEPTVSNIQIESTTESVDFITNMQGGYYITCEENEEKTILLSENVDWNTTNGVESHTAVFESGNETNLKYDFALYPVNEERRASANLFVELAVCNLEFIVELHLNSSSLVEESGYIELQYDPLLIPSSIQNDGVSIDADNNLLIIEFESLDPYSEQFFEVFFKAPSELYTGIILDLDAQVHLDDSDISIEQEETHYDFELRCAYDPNDKLVSPSPKGLRQETVKDSRFLYTIRFQNTGNFPATHVSILDTLDEDLELSSFKVVSASHDMHIEREENVVHFNFDYIFLPDSTSDFDGSQGYVQYSIEMNEMVDIGTEIKNTAHIIFDTNEAITTNTTKNIIIEEFVHELIDFQGEFEHEPNPFRDELRIYNPSFGFQKIRMTSVTGIVVLDLMLSEKVNDYTLNTAIIPPGVYLVEIYSEGLHGMHKVLKL